MKKIYCVEDDFNIRELLCYTLSSTGFEAFGFECGKEFFQKLQDELPDMVLLDIMLPDMDGIEILKTLRENHKTKRIPVIMLTAKASQIDKIKGLNSGADDYMTKPFDIMELVARINSLFRRIDSDRAEVINYNEIMLDYEGRRITVLGDEVILTYKEFELMYYLLSNRGIVLSREKLMNEIWGTDFEGETRTIDVHIRTLRQKLGAAGVYIETIRNVGYKVE